MNERQMEEILARKYTAKLARKGIIEEKSRRLYEYGFELLISSVISIMVTIVIGIVLHAGVFSIGYLAGLIPIRIYAGGYHAKTHRGCYIIFGLIFGTTVLISKVLPYRPSMIICLYICLFTVLYKYAPLEAKNKPLTVEQYKKYRAKVFEFLFISIAVDVVCYFLRNCFFMGIMWGKAGVILLILIQVACDVLANMNINK